MSQLFQQGKDFEQDFLGIRVLNSLLQLAERLKDDGLSEGIKDIRGMSLSSSHHSYSSPIKSREARSSCTPPSSGNQRPIDDHVSLLCAGTHNVLRLRERARHGVRITLFALQGA